MAKRLPITIQIQDPETEAWADKWSLRAEINKTGGGTTMTAGADQYRATLTFKLRYFKALEDVRYNPQAYRIRYRGRSFKVTDYDDFMEEHRMIKLVGEFYE